MTWVKVNQDIRPPELILSLITKYDVNTAGIARPLDRLLTLNFSIFSRTNRLIICPCCEAKAIAQFHRSGSAKVCLDCGIGFAIVLRR